MKSFLVIAIIISTVSSYPSQDEYLRFRSGCTSDCGSRFADGCPPTNCPPAMIPPITSVCGSPDCSDVTNRPFLFPHINPNKYYQCRPRNAYSWEAIERDCGCETYFSYSDQRCVHPPEWINRCSGTLVPLPPPDECKVECPTCIETSTQEVTVSTTSATSEKTTLTFTKPTITKTTSTELATVSTTSTETTTTSPSTTTSEEVSYPSTITLDVTTPPPCNCFCWCSCGNSDRCWFPCTCNINNCSC